MAAFISKKVESILGKPTGACAQTAGELVVPFPASCLAAVQLGGARTFRTAGAPRGVEITTVPASHDSTVARALLSDPEKTNLAADSLSISLGPPSGYVIRFTNGVTAYLSGDTGMHSEMRVVVRDFHKANLVVLNLGPYALAPFAGAFVINELVQPAAVIATHVNEGATAGGKVRPGTRTAIFTSLVKGRPVHPALSGRTMEFDGNARCVAGC